MLSKEQLRYDQLYAYRAGMLNNAWIAGIARHVTKTGGFIQQTNNLNQMIPFILDEGDVMPSWVKNGAAIKINARLSGTRLDHEPVVTVRAIAFEQPSIIDMPAREWFEFSTKEGVPSDDAPSVELPELSEKGMKLEGFRINDTGNMVRVAGFVSGFILEPPGQIGADGKPSNGCVIVSLRQTKDADDVIPIRCYGGKAQALARRLEIGFPIYVEGKLRVRVKETGEPAGADGVTPVRKFLYVHTNMLSVAQKSQIQMEPDWAKQMVIEHRSKRQANREAQIQHRAAAPAAPAAAPVVSDPTAPAPVAAASTAAAPNLAAIDPAILAKLGKTA